MSRFLIVLIVYLTVLVTALAFAWSLCRAAARKP